MNESIVRRLAALEQAKDEHANIRVIIAEPGETAAQALEREGVEDALVVVFG